MSDYKVDDFLIELGFSDKVTEGLLKLEKGTMAAAQRIEKALNKAFNVDASKVLKPSLTRMLKDTNSVSGKIQKSLNDAFKIESATKASMKSLERHVNQTSKKLNKTLKQALSANGTVDVKVRGRRPPTGDTGGSRGGSGNGGRVSRADVLQRQMDRMYNNQFYSGMTRRLEMMASQQATGKVKYRADPSLKLQEFRASLESLREKYKGTGKVSEYQMELKRMIDVNKKWIMTENARIRQMQKEAWMSERLNASTKQLIGSFVSLYTAVEVAKQAIDAGVKRQTAQLASQAVFGKDNVVQARLFASTFSQQIGQGYTDTLKQYTGFAAGANPVLGFEGTQEFYKNAAMFSRIRGASDEDLKGIMTAFQQMASKGKIQAEELRGQLGDRLAGAVQLFGDALGKTPEELDKLMKDGKLLAKDVLPKVSEKMRELVQAAGGMDAVSKQTATSMGKLKGEWENTLVSMFNGSSEGISNISTSLAGFLESAMGVTDAFGWSIGQLLSSMADGVDIASDWTAKISALIHYTQAWYMGLSDSQKKLIDGSVDIASKVALITAGVGALSGAVRIFSGLIAKILSLVGMKGAADALTGAGAGAAETAASGSKGILGRLLGKKLGLIGVGVTAYDQASDYVQGHKEFSNYTGSYWDALLENRFKQAGQKIDDVVNPKDPVLNAPIVSGAIDNMQNWASSLQPPTMMPNYMQPNIPTSFAPLQQMRKQEISVKLPDQTLNVQVEMDGQVFAQKVIQINNQQSEADMHSTNIMTDD